MKFRCILVTGLALTMSVAPALAQKPKTYVNPEFGLHVTFPAGGKVCPAVSGDHPHGFYAWYHGGQTLCGATHIDPAVSAISIYASYNSAFLKSPWDELPASCRKDKSLTSPETLSFRGYKSVSCETWQADSRIMVDVIAYTGKWKDADNNPDPDLQTPYLSYRASLMTTSERFETDMALFRTFIANVDIHPPQ
ncbi:hypothetical protein [Asticcacaulis taihuensis]|uniref:hypothetical protein n=1 Tax=Asticcacaulis taihuensis TaxID=260084 RepID=UPI003F7B9AFD